MLRKTSCSCLCHRITGVKHIKACCSQPPMEDKIAKIPMIEWRLGSGVISRDQAMRELGFEDPEELRRLRQLEDDTS